MVPAQTSATPAVLGLAGLSHRLPRIRTRSQAMGWFLIATAACLALWTAYLALTLPTGASSITISGHQIVVEMGRSGWVTLDSLETLGLTATGVALLRRHRATPWIALATMPLFIADMWLDAMSASTLNEIREAMAMATFGEFPTTLLLLSVACAALLLWRRRPAVAPVRALA